MSQHWIDLLVNDHETTERVFAAATRALSSPGGPSPKMVQQLMAYLTEYVDGCHNRKEEDHLFPLCEARGIPSAGGPLAVMLLEHEQSKRLLGDLGGLAADFVAGDASVLPALAESFAGYTELMKNHFWKETDILYPMARRLFSAEDDRTVFEGIEATERAVGPDARRHYYSIAEAICTSGGLDHLASNLSSDVLAAILDTLPVELSFVDADDVVRYFSHEHHAKIFPRTRGSIGMNVRQCHPEKSVHLVEKILADFKAGKREVAEFWMDDFEGRFIHIRYWPVRSPSGDYMGCLETVQDVTAIRSLEGQRRLLDSSG